tara:strand:+ start:519 stop:1403 length:885 start_codon:yes stop_codon:yes gene_type:complete
MMTDTQNLPPSEHTLRTLLNALPEMHDLHSSRTLSYRFLNDLCQSVTKDMFSSVEPVAREFGPFGPLQFPYLEMGAVTSLDLFGIDELIIFAFYWSNRGNYRRVADLGANIGLHSLCLARCGYEVKCFEPDPETFAKLNDNLARNGASTVDAIQAAISVEDGTTEFIRVIGNRTGSHLAGAKSDAYGALDKFTVTTQAFRRVIEWADLMKIDVEGHEAELIVATTSSDWAGVDAILEVGSPENARAIFQHLTRIGVNMFAQLGNWRRVENIAEMPTSYRDGSLFVTSKTQMPWQ